MNGLTVFLMGVQRLPGVFRGALGMRLLGGGLVLGMAMVLIGVAILAINIVVLIKVIKMEKALRRPLQGPSGN